MEDFDRTKTIDENFPKIERPSDEDVDMLDCKVDVTDFDMPIEIDEVIAEHKRFYYLDHHAVSHKILKYFLEMLDK